jgi:hypothetical protein
MLTQKLLATVGLAGALLVGAATDASANPWRGVYFRPAPVLRVPVVRTVAYPPVYTSPVYPAPVYTAPVYTAPVYPAPVYTAPAYGPVYAPVYRGVDWRYRGWVPTRGWRRF